MFRTRLFRTVKSMGCKKKSRPRQTPRPLALEPLEDRTVMSLTTGLAGYWPFAGSGADLSGGGRNLDVYGGAGYSAGLFDQALDLHNNGAQFAQRPVDDAAFDFGSNNFTLQTWVNFNNTNREQTVFEKFSDSNGPGWTLTKLSSNQWQFYASPSAVITSPVQTITVGDWHQVLVRRQASSFELYHDGNLIVSGTSSKTVPDTTMPLLVGKRNAADGRNFAVDGRIDEVAIWNRALSNQEIADLYHGGSGQRLADFPWITVSPTSGLVTGENGQSANFAVVLATQPTADVTVPLASNDATEGTINATSLTFTTANWNVAQTVTITGVNDGVADGDVPYTIVTGAAVSLDPNFSGLNTIDVSVTNRGEPSLSINDVTIAEGDTGTTQALFTVNLSWVPAATFTVDYATTDGTAIAGSDYTSASGTLTFTPTGPLSQTISVSVIPDAIGEANETFQVVLSNLSDPANAKIADNQGTATIVNDDAVLNPVTGHYYRFVPTAPETTWIEARDAAAAMTFTVAPGIVLQGYLATITSQIEDNFLHNYFDAFENVWVGGSDAVVEGEWRWVTGPQGLMDNGKGLLFWLGAANGAPSGYTDWIAGEPNSVGDEDYLDWNHDDPAGDIGWNDSPLQPYPSRPAHDIAGYIVEYGSSSGNVNDMYVWDIGFESRTRGNKHDERVNVTIRRDSGADGVVEASDALVAGATVTVQVRNSSGSLLGTFTGATGSTGVFTTNWLSAVPNGTLTAEVTALSHGTLTWNGALDPTGNDTDVDGDGLPDQQHTIPHAAASSSTLLVTAAGPASSDALQSSSGGGLAVQNRTDDGAAAGAPVHALSQEAPSTPAGDSRQRSLEGGAGARSLAQRGHGIAALDAVFAELDAGLPLEAFALSLE